MKVVRERSYEVFYHCEVFSKREREDVCARIRVTPDCAELSEVPDVAGDERGSVVVDASDGQRGSRLSDVAEEVRSVSEDGHIRLAVQLDHRAEDVSVGVDAVSRKDEPVTVYRRTGEVDLGSTRRGRARY